MMILSILIIEHIDITRDRDILSLPTLFYIFNESISGFSSLCILCQDWPQTPLVNSLEVIDIVNPN